MDFVQVLFHLSLSKLCLPRLKVDQVVWFLYTGFILGHSILGSSHAKKHCADKHKFAISLSADICNIDDILVLNFSLIAHNGIPILKIF